MEQSSTLSAKFDCPAATPEFFTSSYCTWLWNWVIQCYVLLQHCMWNFCSSTFETNISEWRALAILTLSARSPWKISWKRKHANYGNYKWGFYNSFLRINSFGCRKIKSKNTRFTRECTRKILTSICECIINAHEYSKKNTREWGNWLATRTREWRLPYARAVLYMYIYLPLWDLSHGTVCHMDTPHKNVAINCIYNYIIRCLTLPLPSTNLLKTPDGYSIFSWYCLCWFWRDFIFLYFWFNLDRETYM